MNLPCEGSQVRTISASLEALWIRFRPEILRRIEDVEVALAATENACCTVAMREAAHQAAHKLAGSLGMFGLARGTEIARALEEFFAAEAGCGTAENLREWTAELRRIIDK